jgi:hypothetical protein
LDAHPAPLTLSVKRLFLGSFSLMAVSLHKIFSYSVAVFGVQVTRIR